MVAGRDRAGRTTLRSEPRPPRQAADVDHRREPFRPHQIKQRVDLRRHDEAYNPPSRNRAIRGTAIAIGPLGSVSNGSLAKPCAAPGTTTRLAGMPACLRATWNGT